LDVEDEPHEPLPVSHQAELSSHTKQGRPIVFLLLSPFPPRFASHSTSAQVCALDLERSGARMISGAFDYCLKVCVPCVYVMFMCLPLFGLSSLFSSVCFLRCPLTCTSRCGNSLAWMVRCNRSARWNHAKRTVSTLLWASHSSCAFTTLCSDVQSTSHILVLSFLCLLHPQLIKHSFRHPLDPL
jgi:hypothetical protein